MKRFAVILLACNLCIYLLGCSAPPIEYSDDTPLRLDLKGETLKILQLTDLHLTFGFDYNDRETFALIRELSDQDDYDLIVITGDLTMSPSAPRLFNQLIDVMESLEIPWTFILGNHESDFHSYERFLAQLKPTSYLYFKIGPKLEDGGFGNFRIEVFKDNLPYYNLYFLDTKNERDDLTEEQGTYDYLSFAQVAWYEAHVATDTVDSFAFMHIPLRQYQLAKDIGYEGKFLEDKAYVQGIDTGFFDAMVLHGKTKGVFVGHDHLNDFSFMLNGIYLAYGRISGYNAYGHLERGGRRIEAFADQSFASSIVTRST